MLLLGTINLCQERKDMPVYVEMEEPEFLRWLKTVSITFQDVDFDWSL